METLSRKLIAPGEAGPALPERVLQIGEGKFIRAFADWLLQSLAREGLFEGSVVLTPARAQGAPKLAALREQDGLFTVWTRGLEAGQAIDRFDLVSTITRIVDPFTDWAAFLRCAEQEPLNIVVSNTTELGIAYVPTPRPDGDCPASFPARLAAYLAHRFAHFNGDPDAGMTILPTELIEHNGDALRTIIRRHADDWGIEPAFTAWLDAHTTFCNTLVDRIVPGMPADPREAYERLGYVDTQLVVAEPFSLWAIEADERTMDRLPFQRSTLNVRYTLDLAPYRIQKLRMLNGTHTFMAPLGMLMGCGTVREAATHPVLGPVTRALMDDLTARYSELDAETLREYGRAVRERFLNPFIDHQLRDITLNGLTKFRIRLLPVLARYTAAHGAPPRALSAGLAALLTLYRPHAPVRASDDAPTAALAGEHWRQATGAADAVRRLLGDERIWGLNLTETPGLVAQVSEAAAQIEGGQIDALLLELPGA